MKVHHPTSRVYTAHFKAWMAADMCHWRQWDDVKAALSRRLLETLTRHLNRGGTVVEVFQDDVSEWRSTGNARAVAAHITNRVVGFGWRVKLT